MIPEVEERRGWPRTETRGREHPKYGGDECLKLYPKSCTQLIFFRWMCKVVKTKVYSHLDTVNTFLKKLYYRRTIKF